MKPKKQKRKEDINRDEKQSNRTNYQTKNFFIIFGMLISCHNIIII